ncbi:peptidylprolyl isomerase [Caldimonas sp. KR1-144]|uniref:peptidylprolyl isomerase n=1 Tax=Caldimonas sp. KR1-144 TaxID=3400911 RepID=UPI003C0F4E40
MTFPSNPFHRVLWRRVAVTLPLACALLPALAQTASGNARTSPRAADYIVAVVGQELVTNAEVQQRLAAVQRESVRGGQPVPAPAELRRQLLDTLIDERAQLAYARESGLKVDDPELDRAINNVAAANRVTVAQLRERLARDGTDFDRFRANLRDQILLERVREREVNSSIKITDAEIDAFIESRRAGVAPSEYNIAQVLVAVPEGAPEAEVAARRAQAEAALARAKSGEAFERIVADVSNGSKEQGGALGMRSADRLPDLFVEAVRDLRAGELASQLVRSGAGFHVLKLIDRKDGGMMIQQSRPRHILLRPSAGLSQEQAIARLADVKRQIATGRPTFAQAAREISEDGSAPNGGELGWVSPGQFVPEFEDAMNKLAINQVSDPVVSRFGVHLIEVLERRSVPVDRKQLRDIARNVLREQRFESAYNDWAREVRARAYIEMREPPQ